MKAAIQEYLVYLKGQLEKQIKLDKFDRKLSLRLDWIEAKSQELNGNR